MNLGYDMWIGPHAIHMSESVYTVFVDHWPALPPGPGKEAGMEIGDLSHQQAPSPVHELPDVPTDDGMAVNEAGSWVRDKLTVVRKYDPAFVSACQQWGQTFYVDGLAGSGVNVIDEEGGARIWGSPVIALRSDPSFTQCLFVEQDPSKAAALDERTMRLQHRRVVQQGDVNRDLLPIMREHLPAARKHPVLVLLDPYGMEVDWATLKDLAEFRRYRYKAEILVLFQVDGLNRAMHAQGETDPGLMDDFWGDRQTWMQLWKEEELGKLQTPELRRTRGLELYTDKLKNDLGYTYAFSKDVRRAGQTGGLKYILVFATDNKTGAKIMNDVFESEVQGEQMRLYDMPNTMRRDGL